MSRIHGVWLLAALGVLGCGGQSSSDGTGSGGASGGSGATGGASGGSGGASGGAGGATGGGGGYAGVTGECKADSDCELLNSCCYCMVAPTGKVEPPYCEPTPCFADQCSVQGVQQARCIAGQCTKALECSSQKVACNMVEPSCPDGQTASVIGACWGECVPVTDCQQVDTCFDCTGGSVCVVNDAFESSTHCVNPPAGCSQGCGCLKEKACIQGFDLCTDGLKDGSAVHCECTTC